MNNKLSEIKQEAVHGGLLEAIILLNKARTKVNELTNDVELKNSEYYVETLSGISHQLCTHSDNLSELIGCVLFSRVENVTEI